VWTSQIDSHTLERAEERGATEGEIRDVIRSGFSIPARHGRIGRAKTYDFRQLRHNRYFEQKRVEVIYTTEGDVIVTVTVYVFYGYWESQDADLI
jgi:hypothetical protein